jgi:hypothetical protein
VGLADIYGTAFNRFARQRCSKNFHEVVFATNSTQPSMESAAEKTCDGHSEALAKL